MTFRQEVENHTEEHMMYLCPNWGKKCSQCTLCKELVDRICATAERMGERNYKTAQPDNDNVPDESGWKYRGAFNDGAIAQKREFKAHIKRECEDLK